MQITIGDNFALDSGNSAGVIISKNPSTLDGAGWTIDYNGSGGTSNPIISPAGAVRNATNTDYGQALHQVIPATNTYAVDVNWIQRTLTTDFNINARARELSGTNGYRSYCTGYDATRFSFQVNDLVAANNIVAIQYINQSTGVAFVNRIQTAGTTWSGALLYNNGTNTVVVDRSPDATANSAINMGGLIFKGTNTDTTGPAITAYNMSDSVMTLPASAYTNSNLSIGTISFQWLQRRQLTILSPSAPGVRQFTNIFSTGAINSGWTLTASGGTATVSNSGSGTFAYQGAGTTTAFIRCTTVPIAPTQTNAWTINSFGGGAIDKTSLGYSFQGSAGQTFSFVYDNHAGSWYWNLSGGTTSGNFNTTSATFAAGTTFVLALNGQVATVYTQTASQVSSGIYASYLTSLNVYTSGGNTSGWNLLDPNQLPNWTPYISTQQSGGTAITIGANAICAIGSKYMGNPHVVRNLTGMPILKNNNTAGVFYYGTSLDAGGLSGRISTQIVVSIYLTADPSYVVPHIIGAVIPTRNYNVSLGTIFSNDNPGDLVYSNGTWYAFQGGWSVANPATGEGPIDIYLGTTTTDPTSNLVVVPLLNKLNLPNNSTTAVYDPSIYQASNGVVTLNYTQTIGRPTWSAFQAMQSTATDSTFLNWSASAGWPVGGGNSEGCQIANVGGQTVALYISDNNISNMALTALNVYGSRTVAFNLSGGLIGNVSGLFQPIDNWTATPGSHPALLAYPDPTDPTHTRTRYMCAGFDINNQFNFLLYQATTVNNLQEWTFPFVPASGGGGGTSVTTSNGVTLRIGNSVTTSNGVVLQSGNSVSTFNGVVLQ